MLFRSRAARVTPNGGVLYFVRKRDRLWNWIEPLTLMHEPFAGGTPTVVLSKRRLYSVRCARPPSSLCVLAERKLKRIIFSALNPLEGLGAQLAIATLDLPLRQTHWDLSSDGSRIALLASDAIIRILDFKTDRKSVV